MPYKESPSDRQAFQKVKRAAAHYASTLRKIASNVGHIVEGFDVEDQQAVAELQTMLDRYASFLVPWARSQASRMLADVERRDTKAWEAYTRKLGRAVRKEVNGSPNGYKLHQMLEEQVDLITSLPREAGQRVHKLTTEALSTGRRSSDIAKEIMLTGHVTKSRAELIARTEVGRTAANFLQARAEAVGSVGYIWRTANDGRVRDLHRKLNGKYILWSDPPIAGENGERAHAGAIYRCRCYSEPVLPED